MTQRTGTITRITNETSIRVNVDLDRAPDAVPAISTGLGFFDHMLTALTRHSGISINIQADGDLDVDDHHTIEDVAICLGQAIDQALGERRNIARFGSAYAPLDESLARVVIDLSGRPSPNIELDLKRESIGPVAAENLTHFFETLAVSLRCALHVDVLRGRNDHHKAEAAFKALALALRDALAVRDGIGIPSTKGVLV